MKNKKIQIDIGTNFFNEYFKNGIRDYYTYGFKSNDDFNESFGRTYIKWNMITSLLGDQWEYKKGRIKYISFKDNAERMENPLNQLYFFHNGLNKGLIYLLILLELNEHVKLRDGLNSLNINENDLKDHIMLFENENENKYYRLLSWIDCMNDYERNKMRTTYQMKVIIDRDLEVKRNSSNRDSYRKINNYMYFLRDKGVIETFNQGNSNENLWQSSSFCMNTLLDKFDDENHVFSKKFQNMINFFSQYMILGEIGTLLNKRMNYLGKDQDLFRYKNNYMTESLCDYNLYDILLAIENGWLCHLKYVMGIDYDEFEYLIMPLEIKISVRNGREHLMGFDIIENKYRSLRLDFIEKITFYKHVQNVSIHFPIINEDVKEEIIKDYPIFNQLKSYIEYYPKTKKNLITFQKNFQSINLKEKVKDIQKISHALWGVNTSNDTLDKTLDKIDYLTIVFKYDPIEEGYIIKRLKKERRIGQITHIDKIKGEITFEINILLTNEIIPWLRSYYTRIKSIKSDKIGNILDQENKNNDIFNMSKDVESLYNLYFENHILKSNVQYLPRKRPSDIDNRAFRNYSLTIQGEKVLNTGHEDLFNELFSFYTIILADTLIYKDMNENINKMKLYMIDLIINECIQEYFVKRDISQDCIDNLKKKVSIDLQQKITVNDLKNQAKMMNLIKNVMTDHLDTCFRKSFTDSLNLLHFIDEHLPILMTNIQNKINKNHNLLNIEEFQDSSTEDLLNQKVSQFIQQLFKSTDSKEASAYKNQIIYKIENELYPDLFDKQNRFIYESSYTSYLKDILPLTKVECRWLKTIVNHPDAKLFFDQETLQSISSFIDENSNYKVQLFDLTKLSYYDRSFNLNNKNLNRTNFIKKFRLLMNNIDNKEHKYIKIANYTQSLGYQMDNLKCAPLYLEFSKRDQTFRLCCVIDKKICLLNLDRIGEDIEETDEIFDYDQELQNVAKVPTYKLYIEFYNERGVPDRILNEFSCWKKECVYDEKTYKYTLTLYYDESEKRDNDLVIRLLGYGPYIKVYTQEDDSDNYIFNEYIKRIQSQRELIKENIKEVVHER